MTKSGGTKRSGLIHEIERLKAELAESQETLRAIRDGEVDAIIVAGSQGEQIYSLTGAESVYRLIVETMQEAAITLTFDGTILFCNAQFSGLIGRRMEQLVGHDLREFVHPDQHEVVSLLLIRAREQAVRQRMVFRHADKTSVPTHVSAGLLQRPDGPSICLVAADLTQLENSTDLIRQLRLQQKALRESEDRYRTLFNSIDEGFCIIEVIFDENDNPVDYRFLVVNPAFESQTGLRDVVGRRVRELLPDVEQYWLDAYGKVALKIKSKRFTQSSQPVGRWFDVYAFKVGLREERKVGVLFRDITEQKHAEETLKWSACRDELLSETAASLLQSGDPQGIVHKLCMRFMKLLDCQVFLNYLEDKSTGRLALNSWGGFTKKIAKEVQYLDIETTICGNSARDSAEKLFENVQSRTDPLTGPIRSHGIQAYCCQPLIVKDRVIGTLSFGSRTITKFSEEQVDVMREVSDLVAIALNRIETEAELKELNETLERRVAQRTATIQQQADQLRALASELSRVEQRERKRLASILHDHIQQLIVAARMQVEWLKRDNRPQRVLATAQGIDGILHEALQASRSLTVELSPPVLREAGLIGGLNWLASHMLEKNQFTVHLRASNQAEPPTEEMRFLLFECVRELLLNVVKYAEVREAEVTLMRSGNDRIKLIVSDRGRGFDPDVVKNRQPNEVSFGLFSIQERLAHLGGQMDIKSAPGEGTEVTLSVPVTVIKELSKAEEAIEGASAQIEIRSKHDLCHLLIVDDHKILRDGLKGLFQFEPDITVVGEAADGPSAVELVKELQPDVVIMDVNLGGMDGIEATRRILELDPQIKVIGLSMHADKNIANAMRDAGATAYLNKGGPSEDLIAAIRTCWKR